MSRIFLLWNKTNSLHSSIPLRIKKGLLGIGSGVMYLLRNNFVSGDEDEILESIDEAVFKSVSNVQHDSGLDLEGTYYYLRKRALPPKTGNFVTRLGMVKALFRLKFRQMTVKHRTCKNGKKFVHIEHIHNNLTIPDSVVPVILYLYPRVQSTVDFGCGLGIWLLSFKIHGVKEILGLDGDWCDKSKLFKNIDETSFRTVDLEKPVCLNREYDLVISLEVAEHIPENAADTFVRSLVSAGKVILFSAAIPGQGGYNHVNEQFPEYWQEKFQKHSYVFHDIVRDRIRNNHNVPFWYRQNMFIVAHENIKFPADKGFKERRIINL